ncbi:MAG: Asp-tRNA(Asn)/Glu-tRNA(Gln) amidotransferase subunit GatB [Fimbriimonadaceae bacterium]
MPQYVTSVGMEVHAELLTRSKMFCRCPVAFGGEPNTRVCPVCLGMPGTLPVPNQAAIEMVLRTALALNCTIAMDSVFHRKNYFYPDLPKGYQVSQYGETNPLGYGGWLDIGTKRVRIRRVHLEEDTGKLMHIPGGGAGVDFNRAGVPLMEIVTDFPPDIESSDDARDYLVQLRQVLLYLGVCDGKMEQGSLRCEPNISVRPEGSSEYGTKTELKNLNSFRSVQLGVKFETERQAKVIEEGGQIVQETRGWDEQTESSFLMRTKESEQDYRYFPDPDLVPMQFDEPYIASLRASLPELPIAKRKRFMSKYNLREDQAEVLEETQGLAAYFEVTVEGIVTLAAQNQLPFDYAAAAQSAYRWIAESLKKNLNEFGREIRLIVPQSGQQVPSFVLKMEPGKFDFKGIPIIVSKDDGRSPALVPTYLPPDHTAWIGFSTLSGSVSGSVGKALLDESFRSGKDPKTIVEEGGLTQISDENEIARVVEEAMAQNPDAVEKYRAGKTGVIGFLVGKAIQASGGRANPQMVQQEMKRRLDG